MEPSRGVRPPDGAFSMEEQELVYDGRLIQVYRERVRLPNGVEARHELVRYPAAVAVIPLVEERPGERELVLVEQYRHSVRGYIHEIPAGMLEPDEAPLDCARRELEEETGYVAERWSHVATLLPTPGIAGVTMVYFLAEALSRTGRQALDPTECLSVKRVPLEGVIDRLVHGRAVPGVPDIVDGKTHMAVFYLGARTMGSRR